MLPWSWKHTHVNAHHSNVMESTKTSKGNKSIDETLCHIYSTYPTLFSLHCIWSRIHILIQSIFRTRSAWCIIITLITRRQTTETDSSGGLSRTLYLARNPEDRWERKELLDPCAVSCYYLQTQYLDKVAGLVFQEGSFFFFLWQFYASLNIHDIENLGKRQLPLSHLFPEFQLTSVLDSSCFPRQRHWTWRLSVNNPSPMWVFWLVHVLEWRCVIQQDPHTNRSC